MAMNISLIVKMDGFSTLNLSSDYFHAKNVHYINERTLSIALNREKLSEMIKNDMDCMLKIGSRPFFHGKVVETRKNNGQVVITCEIHDFIGKQILQGEAHA